MNDQLDDGQDSVQTMDPDSAAPQDDVKEGDSSSGNATDDENHPSNDSEKTLTLENARVLVVEDSAPIRMLVKKTLEMRGTTVDEAANGREGLDTLRKGCSRDFRYDLVVLDLMMPGMGGLEMLQHLRADQEIRGTRVIVVTAKNSRADILQCAKFGVANYLLKPFTTQTLVDAIEKALQKPDYDTVLQERRKRGVAISIGKAEEIHEKLVDAVEKATEYFLEKKPVDDDMLGVMKNLVLLMEDAMKPKA